MRRMKVMKTERVVVVLKPGQQNEVSADSYLVQEGHACKACLAPARFTDLAEFITHLTDEHALRLVDYVKNFHVKFYHTVPRRGSFRMSGVRFRLLPVTKRSKVVEISGGTRFIKIGKEACKVVLIENVPTYKRIKLTADEQIHVPEVNPHYLLAETFHHDTVNFLGQPGFHSLLLSGDAGLGKTDAVAQIAAMMNQPMLEVNITGATKVEHLLEEQMIDEKRKTVYYEPRPLKLAAQKGYWLLVNELSAGTPQVMFLFFKALEKGIVRDFSGNSFTHPHFKIIFTDNRIGNPFYYRYHGTHAQNAALLSRVKTTIFYSYLSEQAEQRALASKFPIERRFINSLVRFASSIRSDYANANATETVSFRDLENISGNMLIFKDTMKAFQYGLLNKVQEKADKEFLTATFTRIFSEASAGKTDDDE